MIERESAADIEADAARWVVSVDRDPSLRDERDAWLAGDRRRVGAYVRAEAGRTHLDRASVLAVEAPDAKPLARRRAVIGGFGALAAGLAAAVVAPRLL